MMPPKRETLSVRMPDHPDINEDLIAKLVDGFYTKVRDDSRLGPVFDQNISATWPEHLQRMRQFWSAVMMKTGVYSGKPMPAHMRLRQKINPADFSIWLGLFRETAYEVTTPEIAECFILRAEAIAESLQRGVFFSGSILPPHSFEQGVFKGEIPEEVLPLTNLTPNQE